MLLQILWLAVSFIGTISHGFVSQIYQPSTRNHAVFVAQASIPSPPSSSPLPAENPTVSSTRISQRLKGCVCVVTGASRGIGKGIALALGKEGATVYVTGTSSSRSRSVGPYVTSEDIGGPGTIEETAQMVSEGGGKGIPVLCNHANDDDVRFLFDQVREQQGRLDILVNNVFRVPPGGPSRLSGKFWEQGSEVWDVLHTVGVRSHFVASCQAVPLMIQTRQNATAWPNQENKLPRPLIVMISSFAGISYTFNVPYGVGKAAVDRLAKDMAVELQSEDICVTSLWPGVVRTERNDAMVESGEWDEFVGIPLDYAESPEFTGRAVVALATDPSNLQTRGGTYQVVAELAQEYGFHDVNGSQPPSIRSLKFLLPTYGNVSLPEWMMPDWKLPFWILAGSKPHEQPGQ